MGQGPQEFPITGYGDKEGDRTEGSQSLGFSFALFLRLFYYWKLYPQLRFYSPSTSSIAITTYPIVYTVGPTVISPPIDRAAGSRRDTCYIIFFHKIYII